MRLLLGLVAASCGLGCRVLPEEPLPSTGLDVPSVWDSTGPDRARAVSDDPWWEAFGEPRLAQVVELALEHNRDLAVARARLDASAAAARIAGAERLPTLDFGAGAARRQQIFVGLPVPGGSEVLESRSTTFDASLGASWEADLWGRLRAAEDAARSDFRASEEDLRAARHSIAAGTALAWSAWQEAVLQVALASRTAQSYARSADLVEGRFERGLGSALDVRLAQADRASARALLSFWEAERERDLRRVETLLGRYPAGELEGPGDLPSLPEPPPAGLPGELLLRRPDLRAAELRLGAADDRLYEARADLFPRLRLTAAAGRTSDELADLLDHDFSVWSLAASLVQPIFEGGRRVARVDLARARVREALEGYAAAVLRAFEEVESSLAVEEHLARREEHLRAATEAASAASATAEERYAAGLAVLIEVLEAQRRALTTESQWIAVRRQRFDARVGLHLALGGGFGAEPPPEGSDEPGRSASGVELGDEERGTAPFEEDRS